MNLKKRSLAGLATLSLVAFPLAACSSAASSESAATAESASTVQSAALTETAQGEETSDSSGLEGIASGSYMATFGDKEVTLNGAYLIDGVDVTVDGDTYESVTADEAVLIVVNGGSLTITDATINKWGDASSNDSERTSDVTDEYNFYGLNSAIVVVGEGSSVSVDGSTITTTSSGSNAVVATLAGSADITNTTIETTGNSSRGLHATYEGVITGSDLTITTEGAHSATLATDRGSGTVTVAGTNVLNTSGEGSPLLYSTGTITASGVTGTAGQSQVIVVEGKNHATLVDSNVTAQGNNAVMLYQSFSGDAADEDAQGERSSLVLENTTISYTGDGSVLFFTNTSAGVTLTNASFSADSASALANADEGSWGDEGSNGATVPMIVSNSALSGAVTAGDSSSITVSLTESSTLSGTTSGAVEVSTDDSSTHDS